MSQMGSIEKIQQKVNESIKKEVKRRENGLESKDKVIELTGGRGGKNTVKDQMERKLKERKKKMEERDREDVEEVKTLLEAHSPDSFLNPCGSLSEKLIKRRKQVRKALEKRRKELKAS